MSFKALPVDQRPYKRWAVINASPTIIYDPPMDAILMQVIPAQGVFTISVSGSDDVQVNMQFDTHQSGAIIPLSIRKFVSGDGSVVGLWHD